MFSVQTYKNTVRAFGLTCLSALLLAACGGLVDDGSSSPTTASTLELETAPEVIAIDTVIPEPDMTVLELSEDDQRRAILSARIQDEAQYSTGVCLLPAGGTLDDLSANGCMDDLGTPDTFDFVLFGDNTAAQYSEALRAVADSNGWGMSQLTVTGCLPILEISQDEACKSYVENIIARLETASDVDLVIMTGNFFDARNTRIWAGRTAERLAASGAQIVILGPHARFNASLPELLNDAGLSPGLNLASVLSELSETTFTHDDAFATDMVDMQGTYFTFGDDVTYVSTARTLCPNGAGTCKVFVGNAPMLSNAVMLTPEGAKWMVAQMAPSFFPETR